MRRVFHAKAGRGKLAVIAVLAAVLVYLMWVKLAVWAVVALIPLLCLIDNVINSEYVIDRDALTVRRGRFLGSRTIALAEIGEVRCRAGGQGVEIVCGGSTMAVTPENAESFAKALRDAIGAGGKGEE